MAMIAADVPITRADVQGWVDAYNASPVGTLHEFVRARVNELGLNDLMLNTMGHEHLDDETPIIDMLLDDLGSYHGGSTSA